MNENYLIEEFMKELGKMCFPLGKIEFWTHWGFCAYCRTFGQGGAVNIYMN